MIGAQLCITAVLTKKHTSEMREVANRWLSDGPDLCPSRDVRAFEATSFDHLVGDGAKSRRSPEDRTMLL